MKYAQLKMPIFNFEIVFIQVERGDDKNKDNLKEIELAMWMGTTNPSQINKTMTDIKNNAVNGGIVLRGLYRNIVVVFYRMTSKTEKLMIYAHEQRHIEDDILEHCGINDKETAAYLAGYLAEKLHVFDKWDEDELKREFNYFNKTKKKAT